MRPVHFENNNTDLEEYLKYHADRKRMFPSDRIWRSIRKKLHYKKHRWPELIIVAVVLLMLHIAGTLLFQPNFRIMESPFVMDNMQLFLKWPHSGAVNTSVYPRTAVHEASIFPYYKYKFREK